MANKSITSTPSTVLRGYFYAYILICLILTIAEVVTFNLWQNHLCGYGEFALAFLELLRYAAPSVWTKIALYKTFTVQPVNVCFLYFMYDVIIVVSIAVLSVCVIVLMKRRHSLRNDKFIHVAIFAYIAVTALYVGSVNQTRIGVIQLNYGVDGIFIPTEVLYYTLAAGLVGDLIVNAIMFVERLFAR